MNPTDKASVFKRCQYACYATSLSTAATGNLAALLFLTFRNRYGLSYTQLGLLVLINFGTQLVFDLIFSFYSHKINLPRAVKATPLIMSIGLIIFALLPLLFPQAVYAGLLIGTVLYSAGSGLNEVLTSPTIAAIPSEHSERMMSRLHSCYAWGVVFVVAISAAFLSLAGDENWYWLPIFFAMIPAGAFALFCGAKMPPLSAGGEQSGGKIHYTDKRLLLCVLCIFLGGASECTMSQWCSSYLEQALGIPKLVGDLAGVAVFGVMLGLGRTLYGKFGRHIYRVLLAGSLGAFVCYGTAVVSSNAILGLIACAFTGFCVSMLWPGSLIVMENQIQDCGVGIYAMMAAGGDLGASVVPQLVGMIADGVIASSRAGEIAGKLSLTTEQLGMKAGMGFATIFPLATAAIIIIWIRNDRKIRKLQKK